MSVVWNSSVVKNSNRELKGLVLTYVFKLQFLTYEMFFKDDYSDKKNIYIHIYIKVSSVFAICFSETTAFQFSVISISPF